MALGHGAAESHEGGKRPLAPRLGAQDEGRVAPFDGKREQAAEQLGVLRYGEGILAKERLQLAEPLLAGELSASPSEEKIARDRRWRMGASGVFWAKAEP